MSILASTGALASARGRSTEYFLPPPTYADAVLAMVPLIYYKMDDASGIVLTDSSGNDYHAGISGIGIGYSAPSLVRGEADGASIDYAAAGYSEIAHDSDFLLSEFTVSLWCWLNDLPDVDTTVQYILLSKDTTGLIDGDFTIAIDNDGLLYCHFQQTSPALTYRIESPFAPNESAPFHVLVTADSSGFALWHDGQKVATSSDWLGAWSTNTRALQLAHVGWQTGIYANARIDEVAIFDRVLTDDEILTLARQTDPPLAVADSAAVLETETVVISPLANDRFVGDPADAVVEVVSQGTLGTASVVGQTIEYEADDLMASADDAFTYRITDRNGTSTPAPVTVSITASGGGGGGDDDGFGGTLVFDWQPSAAWIDGVSLIDRHNNEAAGGVADIDRWTGGASVGGGLIKSYDPDVHTNNGDVCWNRAPDGSPSLEAWCKNGTGAGSVIIGPQVNLYDAFQGTPKHCRVVVEIMSCLDTSPTTYKGAGVGTTSGAYPDFEDSFFVSGSGGSTGKYPCGLRFGAHAGTHGGCRANWWQGAPCAASAAHPTPSYCGPTDATFNSNQGSARFTFGSSGELRGYNYRYDRPGRCGQTASTGSFGLRNTGIAGVFHRLEIEAQLTSEAACPSNAIYNNPPISPSLTGDGFAKYYVTKDIDNALGGGAGTRTLIRHDANILWFCRTDNVATGRNNLHKDSAPGANINGFWLDWHYGGGQGSLAEAWLWIRRVQFYTY